MTIQENEARAAQPPAHPPRAATAVFALRWVTDQIIRSQPGAYVLPHPDGGELWICPFGSGKSAQHVEGGPGIVEARQFVEVTGPGGLTREYEVLVSIREIPHVLSQGSDVNPPSGELPESDRPGHADAEAAAEDGPQGS
jgi:hypothetical protein